MRAFSLLTAMVLSACAPLNTLTLSEACRDTYNACLDTCRGTDGHVTAPIDSTPPGNAGNSNQWRPGLASCTDDCSKRANSCR
jgi:hypothetical protein